MLVGDVVVQPIIIASVGDFRRFVVDALLRLEGRIVALDESIARMQGAITELASDISAANQRVTDRLQIMQNTLDKLTEEDTIEDAAFQQTIDQLRAQLADAQNANATVATRLDGLTDSIMQASTAVEGISPDAPSAPSA